MLMSLALGGVLGRGELRSLESLLYFSGGGARAAPLLAPTIGDYGSVL